MAQAARGEAAPGSPPAVLDAEALLALFDANYEPSATLLDADWSLQSLRNATAAGNLPTLTFTEKASWTAYQRWTVELGLTATVPLYRSRADPLAVLHAEQAVQLQLDSAVAFQEARHTFISDLLALSQLRSLAADAARVLEALTEAGWRAPDGIDEAFSVHPAERESIAAHRHILGLQGFLGSRVPDLERRVSRAVGIDVSTLQLASFDELSGAAVPSAPSVDQCLQRSPILQRARTHHAVQLLEQLAQRSPDIRVDLHGSANYVSGQLTGTVALEARLPVPSSWPVGGQLGVVAGVSGFDQTLRVAWPPTPSPFRSVPADERSHLHAQEIQALEHDLSSLIGMLASSAAAVQAAEVQLIWFVKDLHSLADMDAARAAAQLPSGDAFAELHLLRLRSELAFASLAHLDALLNVALVCGAGS